MVIIRRGRTKHSPLPFFDNSCVLQRYAFSLLSLGDSVFLERDKASHLPKVVSLSSVDWICRRIHFHQVGGTSILLLHRHPTTRGRVVLADFCVDDVPGGIDASRGDSQYCSGLPCREEARPEGTQVAVSEGKYVENDSCNQLCCQSLSC